MRGDDGQPVSGLQIRYAPVIQQNQPYRRLELELELNRPQGGGSLSSRFRESCGLSPPPDDPPATILVVRSPSRTSPPRRTPPTRRPRRRLRPGPTAPGGRTATAFEMNAGTAVAHGSIPTLLGYLTETSPTAMSFHHDKIAWSENTGSASVHK